MCFACCLINISVLPERTNRGAVHRPLISQSLPGGQENCLQIPDRAVQTGRYTGWQMKNVHSSAKTIENIYPQEKSEEEMKSKDKTFKNGCLLPAFNIHLASNFMHTSDFPAKPYYFPSSC